MGYVNDISKQQQQQHSRIAKKMSQANMVCKKKNLPVKWWKNFFRPAWRLIQTNVRTFLNDFFLLLFSAGNVCQID